MKYKVYTYNKKLLAKEDFQVAISLDSSSPLTVSISVHYKISSFRRFPRQSLHNLIKNKA